ncbi:uncharacterized protein LOC128721382 [Anopheles nili]|uniref:uncharacterized protein LOC128721382 n=1 Tax=Anopheles nili TaxID=185578 RepID=UPI00237BFA52|nr:uncharacterized protein LOC128721382 [Anopheles nili]
MDFIGDLLNQMSSAFNQETAIPKKEEISMDETLKWRALKNNQFASRTRVQAAGGGASGAGVRNTPANGRKSVSGGGPSGGGGTSNGQRHQTAGRIGGIDSKDSAADESHEDDDNEVDYEGSRSPTEDRTNLTPEVADEDDIEIEIAKDISGEELQEALALSQLVEVEADELKSTPEIVMGSRELGGSEDMEMADRKLSPSTMVGGEQRAGQETSSTVQEEELDSKSSLDVPYSCSASASPSAFSSGKTHSNDLALLPAKYDVDEPLPSVPTIDVAGTAPKLVEETRRTDRVMTEKTITSGMGDGVTTGEGREKSIERITEVETIPTLDDDDVDDDEDDVLIITTDSAEEVVELAETSKEDEDDEEDMELQEGEAIVVPLEASTSGSLVPAAPKDDLNPASEGEREKKRNTVDPMEATENVHEIEEEKFQPKEAQEQRQDAAAQDTVEGDRKEVKFSDTLKANHNATPKEDRIRLASGEKEEEKFDLVDGNEKMPIVEHDGGTGTAGSDDGGVDAGSTERSRSAGRTTRSKKTTNSTANGSPPVAAAAVTHSQRRSQRIRKESSGSPGDGKANGENASVPAVIVVKEEPQPDEVVGAKKRATIGVTGESKPGPRSSGLKSDRSLRSKPLGNGPAVLTRRASETVKVSLEDSNEAPDQDADKTIAGRRGRKRLSQDPAALGPVSEKAASRDDAVGSGVVRRTSRSGFPLEPDESDPGDTKQPVQVQQEQQQPPVQPPVQNRRGRKRKNPIHPDGTSGASTASGGAPAEKVPHHPYKRAARQSRDGSDGILASALARRDKVDSQGRLSRPIKLSAKILANEELRQGFEQHNNGRIIIASELPASATIPEESEPVVERNRDEEPGKPRKNAREPNGVSVASCTTIGSSSEDVTLVSVTLPAPKTAKRVFSNEGSGPENASSMVQQPASGRKPAESSSSSRQTGRADGAGRRVGRPSMNVTAPVPTRPCPDVQTFLQEVRMMRLGVNRSPEENRKLNRRQLKRLGKLKEKHLLALGLQRRGAHQHQLRNGSDAKTSDVELSAGESESSGSEADFVPPQKIGTVGKPSVTLRLRKPESLLEHPPTRTKTSSAGALPLVGVPRAGVNMGRQTGNAQIRQGGKSAHTRTVANTARRTSAAVVLPAAMTTVGARPSASSTAVVSSTAKDRETEQLQRSLQRLGCEVTLIPTRPTPVAQPSGWSQSRTKDSSKSGHHHQQRVRSVQAGTGSVVSATSPSLEIVLEKRPSVSSPPVRQTTGGGLSVVPSAASKVALVCLCTQKSDIFVASTIGSGFCTAVDDIDGQQIGCCNELANDPLNMLRPSATVSFQLLCNMHRKRLEDHGCCTVCGWFCTQGNFAMCKNAHLFHPHCAEKYTLNTPYNPARPSDHTAPTLVLKCPHCSQECPNGEIQVNIQLTTPPVLLPSRKSIVKPAKMTVAKRGNNTDGGSGSKSAHESFRATVESLVPSSVKNMLSTTDHNRLSANTAVSGDGVSARSSTAKDNAAGTKSRFTPKDFSHAVCTRVDDSRVSEIITSGFDIETRFREFRYGTCLHVVSNYGTLAMAYLIMCRARTTDYLNIVDRELHTAVMCAVLGAKSDIVKLLLDSGADATLKGPYGMTVLHLAAKHGQHETVRTILDCARKRLTARELMAFVNAIDNGHWTALAWAAENRYKQTVQQLIEIGADVNVCDRENNTSLHWASLSGCSDTLYLLMTKGCNPNMQNTSGETPLHIACRQGHADICVVLLAQGASLSIRNTANELPQDIIENRNSECADIIAANLKMRSLSKNMKEMHVLCSDISNGRERYPVQVVYYTRAGIDRQHAMPQFKYVQRNVKINCRIQLETDVRNMRVCSCKDSCTSGESECLCAEQTWYTNDGRLVSDFNYLDPPTIVECGDSCDCNQRLCRNRVVQHGLDVPLQLHYIPGKAWGVRTLLPIPKGSFLIEYVGELLTDEVANHRDDDSYLFDLGVGYCIDASAYGNVSRFFNHSCQPNVSPVSVYYDHQDQQLPRVALFACRDIEAQEEICFDYGEKFWMVKKGTLQCRCNTGKCRYRNATTE